MATQPLVPATVLLHMPTGDGKREVVQLPTEDVDPAFLIANQRSGMDLQSYQNVAHRMRAFAGWNPRRIFVTSPTAGDGKTCTAFNLAWTLAMGGASVLLVELNFGHPRLAKALGGLEIHSGVDSAIRGLAHPQDTVFSLGTDSFGVAAVKTAMSKREFKQCVPGLESYLNWGSGNYDWLVLDCPAALSSAWNRWFHDHARPALLVIREGHTPAIQVRQTIKRLPYRIKGFVLNDSSHSSSLP